MKFQFLFFLSLFLLSACTDTYIDSIPEQEEPQKKYLEFEGVAGMGADLNSVFFAETNNYAWEKRVRMSYDFGRRIVFESDDLEFESNSGEIYGGQVCQPYACVGDEYEKHKVVFYPDSFFWECVAENNCDPQDEVFEFVISVWDSE